MCLAVVGRVLELDGQNAVADVQGNRVTIVTAMVPEAKVSDCVLIHAGFALAVIDEAEYDEQRRLVKEITDYGERIFRGD